MRKKYLIMVYFPEYGWCIEGYGESTESGYIQGYDKLGVARKDYIEILSRDNTEPLMLVEVLEDNNVEEKHIYEETEE